MSWLDSFSFIKKLRRSIDGLQYTTIQTRIKPLKWLLSLQNGLIILYIIRNITSVYNLPTVTQIQRIIVHYELYKIRFHTVNQSLRPTQDTEKHFTIADFFFMTKKTASTNHSFNMYNYDIFSLRSNRLQPKKVCFICTKMMQVFLFHFVRRLFWRLYLNRDINESIAWMHINERSSISIKAALWIT